MPSKLRKAIELLKDSTSITLAPSKLEAVILKATTHEEVPAEDRHINEILLLTSSNKGYAASCAQVLAKRIGRTHNWIVALKSLMIVLRVLQDGDPYFPREILMTMKRGKKILNLSNFRDDYNSSPWDYTAFVRTVALYLNERLECFLTGKLQRRMIMKDRDQNHYQPPKKRFNEHVRDMKPAVLIDKITHWQKLLDRAIGTRPTGAAKTNRLVQVSLYAIVRETFDLYRDISDGLTLLLDSFFHLQYQSCIDAYQACIKSSKQFEELNQFYTVCKDVGVGRHSEYPSVQTISEDLIDTLQEYLKDKSSFPEKPQTSSQKQLPTLPLPNGCVPSEGVGRQRGTSLEDLISVTEPGTSSSFPVDRGRKSGQLETSSSSIEDFQSMDTAGTSPALSGKQSTMDDLLSLHTAGTSPARSIDRSASSAIDLRLLDNPVQTAQSQNEANQPSVSGHDDGSRDEWERVLAETASNISSTQTSTTFDSAFLNSLYDQALTTSNNESNYNNPFLTLGNELAIVPSPAANSISTMPTFQATPTFSAENPNATRESDLFNLPIHGVQSSSQGTLSQPHFIWEQQLWLQNQNEIMAKLIS
ncbi:hypothetical protein AQUCO_03200085v1 [Aquilegia coerulea]|uniref:ENTH domain-containing protein n=1 Tax=Aquilegia coerulea TaxID=218851 RepID=A0A2G5D035_AQUCA|nr:hypothetical protein AQUCO_03200085v1 [Aquilegia coerulea]